MFRLLVNVSTFNPLRKRHQNHVFRTSIIVFNQSTIPGPTHLELERQVGNSVVVKWTTVKSPKVEDVKNDTGKDKIKGFVIYIDGKAHQTVLGNGRTKALVSDLNLEKVCFNTKHIYGACSLVELSLRNKAATLQPLKNL